MHNLFFRSEKKIYPHKEVTILNKTKHNKLYYLSNNRMPFTYKNGLVPNTNSIGEERAIAPSINTYHRYNK